MKNLGLLLLTLPLAACASPQWTAQIEANELANAKAACASHGVGPSDANFLQCLNRFTVRHYAMNTRRSDDGSLTLVTHWGNSGLDFGIPPYS